MGKSFLTNSARVSTSTFKELMVKTFGSLNILTAQKGVSNRINTGQAIVEGVGVYGSNSNLA